MFLIKKYGKIFLSGILLSSMLLNIALAKVSYFDVCKTAVHVSSPLQTHVQDVKYRNYRWLSIIAESNEIKNNIIMGDIKAIHLPIFLCRSNLDLFESSKRASIAFSGNANVTWKKPFSALCTLLI